MENNVPDFSAPADGLMIGWVPCVSGHLDFGLMNAGLEGGFMPASNSLFRALIRKKDRSKDTINFAATGKPDHHNRRIVLQSWVDWRDEETGDGEVQVVVTAEVNKSENLDERFLSGNILMFKRSYKSMPTKPADRLMGLIGELKKAHSRYKASSSDEKKVGWLDFQEKMNGLWEKVDDILASGRPIAHPPEAITPHVYTLAYEVSCRGIVHIRYRDNEYDQIEPISDDEKFTLARQAFYYLKYSLHMHKHHVDKVDAMTTIAPCFQESDKQNAHLKLVGQLKRELTSIKRSQTRNRKADSDSALGIVGYLKSLLETLRQDSSISKVVYKREMRYLEGMKTSFQAQDYKIATNMLAKNEVVSSSRQWGTAIIAIISISFLAWFNVNRLTSSVIPTGGSFKEVVDIPDILFLYQQGELGLYLMIMLGLLFYVIVSAIYRWHVFYIREQGGILRFIKNVSLWGLGIRLSVLWFVVLSFVGLAFYL